MKKNAVIDRARYESFGGIISSANPPFLAWVDRDFMRGLGYEHSPLWDKASEAETSTTYLSAPTEVHWALTNTCKNGCSGCYMDSGNPLTNELSTNAVKKSLAILRDLGVFHVALGGGEAFERPDFPEIVQYCREKGIVPNLSTSGCSIGEKEVSLCKMMGQVNFSIDGTGVSYGVNGRKGDFATVKNNLNKLVKSGVRVGINCVVTRANFHALDEVVAFAAEHGCNEVEFLKYKPSGRGTREYEILALTQEMIRSFYPMLLKLQRPEHLELKIDCSFIPALLFHRPPIDDLVKCAISGCDAGNLLLAIKSDGTFAGCSFVNNPGSEPASGLSESWHTSRHLRDFREMISQAHEPCSSCEYLSICRCGCRAAALYYTNDFFAPDPECPFVYDYQVSGDISADNILHKERTAL